MYRLQQGAGSPSSRFGQAGKWGRVLSSDFWLWGSTVGFSSTFDVLSSGCESLPAFVRVPRNEDQMKHTKRKPIVRV